MGAVCACDDKGNTTNPVAQKVTRRPMRGKMVRSDDSLPQIVKVEPEPIPEPPETELKSQDKPVEDPPEEVPHLQPHQIHSPELELSPEPIKEPEADEPEDEEVHEFVKPEPPSPPKPDPEEILREKELALLAKLHERHCRPLVKLFQCLGQA